MAKVLARSVLFDGTASFHMAGELGEDTFGRFITSGEDRFYFPANHLIHVRVFPDVPAAEVPAVAERHEEVPALSSGPSAEPSAEEVAPALEPGKISKAMEMAILVGRAKREVKKMQKQAKTRKNKQ
jgi:hypothetical protein